MNFQKMNFQKILLFLVMSATALATATAVIAMSAILPRQDDETSQNEVNSWQMFPLATARSRYFTSPKVDSLRFATEAFLQPAA
jgi:hypothetical protein